MLPPARWSRTASEVVFRSDWFDVRRDQVRRPDGTPGEYDHVVVPGSVTVLAVDERRRVLVTRQWVYVHGGAQWRLPGGADRPDRRLYAQDGRTAVELARQAQQRPGADGRVLGLAARCEAQGHAMLCDVDAYRRALDRATELLAAAVADRDGLPLGPTAGADHVALSAGWALYDLGRPDEAAELLDREVPLVDGAARRTRARFGARRVLAHLDNGRVERACELLGDVIADAEHVDSATVRIDLRAAARVLQRSHLRPEVRSLMPRLTEVMLDATPGRVPRCSQARYRLILPSIVGGTLGWDGVLNSER